MGQRSLRTGRNRASPMSPELVRQPLVRAIFAQGSIYVSDCPVPVDKLPIPYATGMADSGWQAPCADIRRERQITGSLPSVQLVQLHR